MNQTLLFGKKLKSIPNTQPFTNTCTCKTPQVILVNDAMSDDLRKQYICMLPEWFYFILDSTPACWALIQGPGTYFT